MKRASLGSVKKVTSECFATQNAKVTARARFSCSCFSYVEVFVCSLKLYEINTAYINYLFPFAPHLFRNSNPGQHNERKYIGIVLHINDMNYFAPLSSL